MHIPVLKDEVLEVFVPLEEGVLIDCTLGFGGHTKALLDTHPLLEVIGIDQDAQAREYCKTHLRSYLESQRLQILEGNFSLQFQNAIQLTKKPIIGVLADIGVSSLQLDDLQRGFCFDSPFLDMRMDCNNQLKASEVLNTYPKDALEKIFRDYGEIKEYKKLVSLVVEERKKVPFSSAKQFSTLLQKHFHKQKIHPATLAFQALRIEVNDELGVLQHLLEQIQTLSHAIVAMISFHSLEDRIIKNAFRQWEKSCICPPNVMRCQCGNNHNRGKILTKKPLSATLQEIKSNPRSRSAKLRAFQFRGSHESISL